MNIPPKYEDVVEQLEAALAREAALRDELNCPFRIEHHSKRLIEGLKQRLTVAEQRVGELECFSVKQAALLDELGIPLDEVDDLFGETLKNANRYEYLRSVMAIENFPDPHPEWSEPSEVESKRIDDLCDAALKPAAECEHSFHYFGDYPRRRCNNCNALEVVAEGEVS